MRCSRDEPYARAQGLHFAVTTTANGLNEWCQLIVSFIIFVLWPQLVYGQPNGCTKVICDSTNVESRSAGLSSTVSGKSSQFEPSLFKWRNASVPKPSIDRSCKSPPKYRACSRESGSPTPKPASGAVLHDIPWPPAYAVEPTSLFMRPGEGAVECRYVHTLSNTAAHSTWMSLRGQSKWSSLTVERTLQSRSQKRAEYPVVRSTDALRILQRLEDAVQVIGTYANVRPAGQWNSGRRACS